MDPSEDVLMGENSPDYEEDASNDARDQRGSAALLCPPWVLIGAVYCRARNNQYSPRRCPPRHI